MKKILLVFAIIILVGGAFFFLNSEEELAVEVGTEAGMQAPAFTLLNLNNKEVSLADYRGQKVFLNFWATWCPPCREEMPDLQKLHEEYDDEIAVLTVNIGESKPTAVNFMMENKLNLPVLLDQDKSTAQDFLVRAIPTTYILDEKGVIIEKTFGGLSYNSMLKLSGIEE